MGSLEVQGAAELAESGRFKDAFEQLRRTPLEVQSHHKLLLGDLLWRLGEHDRAKPILTECAEFDVLGRSRALEGLGSIARDEGDLEGAKLLLEQAVKSAVETRNAAQQCYSQLALWGVLLNLVGTQACEAHAREVRLNVLRVGNPTLTGLLHTRFAEFEARRGNSDRAFRHIDSGLQVVARQENVWVEGGLWLVRSAVEWVSGQITHSLRSARKARAAAAISGHRQTEFGALANLGYVALFAGNPEAAGAALGEAEKYARRGGHRWMMVKETEANLELIRGNRGVCENILRALEVEQRLKGWRPESFPCIEVHIARARLLKLEGRSNEALVLLREAADLARRRGDWPIQAECQLEIADVSLGLGRQKEAFEAFDEAVIQSEGSDIARAADLHWLSSRFSAAAGRHQEARVFAGRASRIWTGCGGGSPHRKIKESELEVVEDSLSEHSRLADVSGIAGLLRLGATPQLLAREVWALFGGGGWLTRVRLLKFSPGRRKTVFDSGNRPRDAVDETILIQLEPGGSGSFQLELSVPRGEGARVGAFAATNLIRAAVELHKFRKDEKYRSSLWPAEDGLLLEGNVFVAPRMRELRLTARRIAVGIFPF